MTRTRILIFAKAPVPGKAKTRLIPALGEAGAARLAHEMLAHTVREAVTSGLDVELCATPAPTDPDWKPFLPDIETSDQGEGDLGERLARATERVIGARENILLIGTDCPELGRERLKAAAKTLEHYDAILHPAQDGGYVLLGLRRFHASIFTGIAWSTSAVSAATEARIEALRWSLHIGETLRDIDEPEDLNHLRHPRESGDPAFLPGLVPRKRDSRFRGNDGEASGGV